MDVQNVAVTRIVCLAVCLTVGCKMQTPNTRELLGKIKLPGKQTQEDRLKIGPTKVITDATALALELPESDLQAREKFRQRFAKLIAEDRLAAADILVARHPDHAYDVLTCQFKRNDNNLVVLAASYDRYCGGTSGWHAILMGQSAPAVDQYFSARKQLLGTITSGQFEATESIVLVEAAEQTEHEALIVDAWYQTGVAALLRQQNTTAADAFAKSARIAGNRHGMQAAGAQLLCSESRRRANDFAGATTAWQESVDMACQVMRTRNVADTVFWQRAGYLQPVGTPWPADVQSAIASVGRSDASAIRTELLRQLALTDSGSLSSACWVEAALGSWCEARGETQKALVHLKKAETLAEDAANAVDWLRLAQAPLLVKLGQKGTATTLLAPLIAREDNSPAMLAAMSKLGVIKLSGGSPQHGVRLLHRAVVDSGGVEWPGKSSARADLALGLLMIGEIAEGKNQLRQAQTQFQAEGEIEQLAKSLFNEQKFLEHSEADKTEIAALEQRLQTMQL